MGRSRSEDYKGAWAAFGDDEYAHYLDGGDGFMAVFTLKLIYLNSLMCVVSYVNYTQKSYLLKKSSDRASYIQFHGQFHGQDQEEKIKLPLEKSWSLKYVS